ncbi:MAG: MATE family efflux transporter [Gluconacetobacter diazotrophicus]|nr:MATE family efflux transporter [Gluconacetobacter diazotrophicus]
MMLSSFLQAGSSTLANIYLGRMIGTDALASASVLFPVVFFFIALVLGMGAGASVLIGQFWGADEPERARVVAANAMAAAILAGVAVAAVLTPLAEPVLRGLGTPARVLPGAVAYATVILSFMPVPFVFLLAGQLLRGIGDTFLPMLALALAVVLSMLITPALIRGWFGLPRLGVASAAWAWVLSWTVGIAWLGFELRRRGSPLAPDRRFLRAMRPDWRLMATVLRLGVPAGVQMVALALAEMVLLGLANRYGADATAAYGAVNQVLAYVQFPAFSIGITVSILSSQLIGAGLNRSLAAVLRMGMVWNVAVTGGLVLLGYVFSRPLVELFVARPAVVALTETMLHVVLWSTVLYGAALILAGQMRASGVVIVPTLLLVGCIVLVEVPVGWVGSARFGVVGVWSAYPACFTAMLLVQAAFFFLAWRGREIARLVPG